MAETDSNADANDGTVAGCIEFLGYTMKHGYVNPNTASSIRTGVNKVMSIIDGLDDDDMREMNVDDLMQRFRTLARGKDIKQESIDEYERRFRQAREWYLKFLANDDSWKPSQRPVKTTSNGAAKKPTARPGSKVSVAPEPQVTHGEREVLPGLITYPFPIRSGVQGEITLPEDLTRREAQRIAAFISTLAFDDEETPKERLAITQ